ncbi:hypothetical protein MTR67_026911 [Solanum verrucosum]|uniref:Reverse transcriptase n=1 Tax=Solanum verrucosum TaxID=315347 RepID=A0AAF0R1E3_SOLVR|nr:hypothetical protein MTR67_026911 [Solanum verrucosum]
MSYATHYQNGKIWVFVQGHIHVGVISNTDQQLTLQLHFQDTGDIILATMIYTKCDALERINMWDDTCNISVNYNMPWLVGGDFNVIMSDEEKIEDLPVYPQAYEDFAFCMNSCELLDINVKSSPFTWWNGKIDGECIFKKLDRIMVNQSFIDFSGNIEMEHLERTGSDHAPILLTCGGQSSYVRKPFRFLKFWVEKEGFLETVTDSWKSMDSTDVFISLKQKMKNTKTALSRLWSEFTAVAGIDGPFLHLKADIVWKWWKAEVSPKLKLIYKAVPLFILWQIWKRRNKIKHGGKMSTNYMIMEVGRLIHLMAKNLYPWMRDIPGS